MNNVSNGEIIEWASAHDVADRLAGYPAATISAAIKAESEFRAGFVFDAVKQRLVEHREDLEAELVEVESQRAKLEHDRALIRGVINEIDVVFNPLKRKRLELEQMELRENLPPFTLNLQGIQPTIPYKPSSVKNEGYNTFRSRIERECALPSSQAGTIARFLATGGYKVYAASYEDKQVINSMFEFHRNSDNNLSQSDQYPTSETDFPYAVTIKDVTLDKLLRIPGFGQANAEALLRFINILSEELSAE
jgi:hypothetical protein